MSSEKEIKEKWRGLRLAEKLGSVWGKMVSLSEDRMECLKKTGRSSIWKLTLEKGTQSYPIILKIYNSPDKHKNEVELKMYQNAYPVLSPFMPEIYLMESNVNGNKIWILMEYVQQLRGQIKMDPRYFDYIIPAVANLHATTYESRMVQHQPFFLPWLPHYQSKALANERRQQMRETIINLHQAMRKKHLKEIVEPYYSNVLKILQKGPNFFPELLAAGNSVIHGDLHVQNISSNDTKENKPWDIKFIDWETARYGSGWFDMAVLVEILMDFRKDWHPHEEEIRQLCVKVYAREMAESGIVFPTDPMKLYKMAYMQRTLEKGLSTHLRRELQGRSGKLLSRYLEKTSIWGKEFGLY